MVLVNYGTVLLLQYPQGHWDLPKGHVEDDDTDRTETMLRELAEETGTGRQVLVGLKNGRNTRFDTRQTPVKGSLLVHR